MNNPCELYGRAFKATFLSALLALLSAIPLRAEAFSVKVPLQYVGESLVASFAGGGSLYGGSNLYEHEGAATNFPYPFSVDTNDPGFPIEVRIPAAGLIGYMSASDVENSVNNGGFVWPTLQLESGATPVLIFLLPPGTQNNFALAQMDANGTVFNVPLPMSGSISLPDNSCTGDMVYVPKAYVTYDPSYPFWVVDLTNHTKSPQNTADLRYTNWVPDNTVHPLMVVNLYLEGREAGHKFTVHSWAEGGPVIETSVTAAPVTAPLFVIGYEPPAWSSLNPFVVSEGSACLRCLVGEGMSFYVTRDAEGFRVPSTGAPPLVVNMSTSLNWSLFGRFPDPPNRTLQSIGFSVNAQRYEHEFSVRMSDGYKIPAEQNGESTIYEWNGQPVSNPLYLITLGAVVDPLKNWWLVDDTTGEEFPVGESNIFDGWSPQFFPYPTITIRLPPWGLVSSPYLQTPGSEDQIFPVNGYYENTEYTGVDGMVNFYIAGGVIEFSNPSPGDYGMFYFWGGFMEGQRTVYPGENDFRLDLGQPESLALNISSTRWEHELIVRHAQGTSYPIEKHSTQGDVSFDPNQSAWWNSYYYFDATSSYRPEIPWYVEDRTTNERIGPYPSNADLINWLYLMPPDPMDAFAGSPSSIHVAWSAVPGATHYQLERRQPFGTGTTSQWSTLATLASPTIQYDDPSIAAGSIYAYRTIALKNSLQSSPSDEVWARIDLPLPPDSYPDSDGDGIVDSDEGTADIDGDGLDSAHDADRDNDGVSDFEDEWPDDPRLSESISPKFYGIIDLSTATYSDGTPVALPGPNDLLALDDQTRVSWMTKIENVDLGTTATFYEDGELIDSFPLTGNQYTITTWNSGTATKSQLTDQRTSSRTTEHTADGRIKTTFDSSDRTYSIALQPDGAAVGSVGISSDDSTVYDVGPAGGSTSYQVIRGYPGDVKVPAGYLIPNEDLDESDDNGPYHDYSMEIAARIIRKIDDTTSVGTISYVEEDGHGGYLQRRKLFRGSVDGAYVPDGSDGENAQAGPISSNGQMLVTYPDQSTPKPCSIWKTDGSLTNLGRMRPNAINNAGWVVGSLRGLIIDGPTTQHEVGYEGPEPDPANPFAPYGRGELGFVWNQSNGMRTFHDLLPTKYQKMIRNAVPFMITNVVSATGRPRIFFKANVLISGAPNAWKDLTLLLDWEDPDGAGPKPPEPILHYISLGEKQIAGTETYAEVEGVFTGVNDQLQIIGAYSDRPALFGPIEILDNQKNPNPLNDLVISKWEEAFVIENQKPELKADFISELHDSFHIRYPFASSSPTEEPKAWFGVARVGAPTAIDPFTEIKVIKDPSRPGCAITEKTHILVSSPRDDTDSIMNSKGTGADETNAAAGVEGDRTHFAALDDTGFLKVEQPHGLFRFQIPISHKKRIKKLPLKVYLVRKSIGGPLCANRAWLDQFLEMTKRRLAQVNIIPIPQVEEIDPPKELELERGLMTQLLYEEPGTALLLDNSWETEQLLKKRAARSSDDVEIFVVNKMCIKSVNTNQYMPYPLFGFAHIDADYTRDTPLPPRLYRPSDPVPTGSGLKWKRGAIVIAAETASGVIPTIGDRGVFEGLGGHELSHILGDMDHKAGPLKTTNLVCDGTQTDHTREHEHPLGSLRLDREQESRMRVHRALK